MLLEPGDVVYLILDLNIEIRVEGIVNSVPTSFAVPNS